MSWIARLLSPSKRRTKESEDVDPPSKRSKLQGREIFGNQNYEALYPFGEQDLLFIEPASATHEIGHLLSSVLVPRPLVLVASLDHASTLTIAPSTYCTVVSEDPAYISVGLSKDALPENSLTDAVSSVIESRVFTVNIVSEWLAEKAAQAAGSYRDFKPDTNADLANTGLTTSSSSQIDVPRITQAAAYLECRMKNRISIRDREGEVASIVVIAEVLSIAVEEQITKDGPGGLTGVDASKLQPVAVLGGDLAGSVTDFYPLTLDSIAPIDDPPAEQAAAEDATSEPTGSSGGLEAEDIAVAVATAVAETLAEEPGAPAVENVEITLKESSATGPAKSTRSASRAVTRETTPVSVTLQAAE